MNESGSGCVGYDPSSCKHGFQAACLDPATLRPRPDAWHPENLAPCGYCVHFQQEGQRCHDLDRDGSHVPDVPCNEKKAHPRAPRIALGLVSEDDVSVATTCMVRIRTLSAEPITPRSMLLIERFVKIAREAWAIEKGVFFEDRGCGVPYGQLGSGMNDSLVMGGTSYGLNPGTTPVAPVYMGPNLGVSNGGLGSTAGPMMPAAAGAAENFGVTAIRELVSAFSAKKPEEIVRAIAAAKELGQHDLAVRLEATLGVAPAAVPSPDGAPKIPTVA